VSASLPAEQRAYKVRQTTLYKGAKLEERVYQPSGNVAVSGYYGRDYLGSFNSISTAKRAVTSYLKRGVPPS
jgi:hypothetical protein